MMTPRWLLGTLCLCGALWAQTGGPPKETTKKSELETMLEEAFKNNPDLRVAEAKLAETQAMVARERVMLVQKVAKAAAELKASQALAQESERRWARDQNLVRSGKGVISAEEVDISRVTAMKYKAEAEVAEATLNAVIGRVSDREKALLGDYTRRLTIDVSPSMGKGRAPAAETEVPSGPLVDKLRAELTADDISELNMEDIDPKTTPQGFFDYWSKKYKLSGVHTMPEEKPLFISEAMASGRYTYVGLLQRIEDVIPSHVFIVRDYGLVYVVKDKVPPGAMTLKEFRKTLPKAAPPAKEKPTADAEGLVKKVDGDLATLSVGSDAGLKRGVELQAFRLGAGAKFLGKLRVVEVSPKEAVAQAVGKLAEPLKEGDRVASKLLGATP